MNDASAMSFVWDTKPDFPSEFSSYIKEKKINSNIKDNCAVLE